MTEGEKTDKLAISLHWLITIDGHGNSRYRKVLTGQVANKQTLITENVNKKKQRWKTKKRNDAKPKKRNVEKRFLVSA